MKAGVIKAGLFLFSALALSNGAARAQDLRLDGMLDLRLFHPSDQRSNLDGGLGKTERGSGDRASAVGADVEALTLRGVAGITPEFRLIGEVRSDPRQRTALDVLDAYAVWRPVSTTRWRWSVKGGVFFAPISLENDGIGWTSPWTLTPSAINSWVGDELRTLGTEGKLEWRGDVDHIEATAAVYGWNQPAGAALEDRGWTFNGTPLGLLDHIRLSDVPGQPGQPPDRSYSNEFRQLDHTPGWYAALAWDRPDIGRLQLLRYDNMADPSANDHEFGWRTRFWSLGFSTEVGELVVLAQAMIGSTVIVPAPAFVSTTYFYAGYVLVGWERQNWRYAVRLDQFGTNEVQPGPDFGTSEHGTAVTAAITWSPAKWIRVTGEVLEVDSWRAQRLLFGKSPRARETQAQLGVRLLF
ncbi:MAG: hypothetical protein QOG25_985 [Acetobacteraceae bacterium]|nr:hypothetical protein [Acetobacteraceae bacterium]